MGLFDVTEDTVRAEYYRAYTEQKGGYVNPINYPALNHALTVYASQHNCSYDEAVRIAMGGKPRT